MAFEIIYILSIVILLNLSAFIQTLFKFIYRLFCNEKPQLRGIFNTIIQTAKIFDKFSLIIKR